MKLYEINEKYLELLNAIEVGEIPEECIKDTLDCIEGDLIEKLDCITSFIKSLEAEEDAIKKEVKTLQDRAKTKRNKIENLKSYILTTMQITNKGKIETSRNVLRLTKNPPKLIVKDEEKARIFLTNIKDGVIIEEKLNKSLLKEKLKRGERMDFAELRVESSLRIK